MAETRETGETHGVEGGQPGPIELRQHLAIYRRAVRAGWPVSARQRQLVIDEGDRVLNDPDASRRERINAAKLILAAEGQNIKLDDQALKLFIADRQSPKQEQHLHLHGELATMSADELRAYRKRIRADIASG